MSDDFGPAVKLAREKRRWSQEFLAAKVGTTQSTIDRIETGATRRSRVLPEIAAALEIELPNVRPAAKTDASVRKPDENPNFTRVTYVLPRELVARIAEYKDDAGIASDDEAVRRLIDDNLKKRDTPKSIAHRLLDKYRNMRSLREAVGFVLANHPLISSIEFEGNNVKFKLIDGQSAFVNMIGQVWLYKSDGSLYKFHSDVAPKWVSSDSVVSDWLESDELPF